MPQFRTEFCLHVPFVISNLCVYEVFIFCVVDCVGFGGQHGLHLESADEGGSADTVGSQRSVWASREFLRPSPPLVHDHMLQSPTTCLGPPHALSHIL